MKIGETIVTVVGEAGNQVQHRVCRYGGALSNKVKAFLIVAGAVASWPVFARFPDGWGCPVVTAIGSFT